MSASLRVLTASTLDSSPSLLLTQPDGSKILIDCGEGCQRACIEYGQRIATVRAVCLTAVSHNTVGGLPGFLLTAADIHATMQAAKDGGKELAPPVIENEISIQEEEDDNDQKSGEPQHRGGGRQPSRRQPRPRWPFCSITAQEAAHVNLFGPRGSRLYIEALRHFTRRDAFKLRVYDQCDKTTIAAIMQDNDDPIPAVPLQTADAAKNKTKKKKKHDKPEPTRFSVTCIPFENDDNGGDNTIISLENEASQLDDREQQQQSAGHKRPRDGMSGADAGEANSQRQEGRRCRRQTLSYLFTTPPLVGKFLLQEAEKLGIPKGPLFAQLKAGKAVTFVHPTTQQETTIESHQVVEPASPGIAVLILRYPAKENGRQLDTFFESIQSILSQRLSKTKANLDVVVHIASPNAFNSQTAKQWRQTRPAQQLQKTTKAAISGDVHHLWMQVYWDMDDDDQIDVMNIDLSPHVSAAFAANARSNLCPEIYRAPLQEQQAQQQSTIAECAPTKHGENDGDNGVDVGPFTIGNPGVQFDLLPRKPPDARGFAMATRDDEPMEDSQESDAQELANAILEKETSLRKSEGVRPTVRGELLFTGTASAVPCKHRNVSGMLLSNSDGRSMLLDAGEGTVGQLYRMQALAADAENLLSKITVVWISHPHADHHLGILRLLEQRRATTPLLLIAPPPILHFLKEYAVGVDPRIARSYHGVDCYKFCRPNQDAVAKFNHAIGFTNCQSVRVDHCPYAYAVIIDGTPFGRVVYSGDCRPSYDMLPVLAKPCDLLIHESTFEDSERFNGQAVSKKHSTVGEALQIAQKLKARWTVLTHFSQRYPRVPPPLPPTDVVDTKDMDIIFAFDYQCLTPSSLRLASRLTPALRKLFPEEQCLDVENQDMA